MLEVSIRISVCICTYNQSAYIEKAIRSALEQTISPAEIIVSNDCSTDDTAEILTRLTLEIPTLRIINHTTNLGIAKNVDSCLRLASGDFVVRLDSDDLLHPTFLEQVSGELMKHPTAGYGHAAVLEINEYGMVLKERNLFRTTGFQSDLDAVKATLKGYRVAANILMFRKQALQKVEYLSGRPNFGEDYHLTAAISRAGFGNVYVAETLASYRVWSDTDRLRQKRKLAEIMGLQQVFSDVIEPAFEERKWSLALVRKSKTSLACAHSDCLGWQNYTRCEKEELLHAIRQLSTSYKVEFYSWIYLNGRGLYLTKVNEIESKLKSIIKAFILKRKKYRSVLSIQWKKEQDLN
jgi:glycosyltransferase involved in cell wall biosynthesis